MSHPSSTQTSRALAVLRVGVALVIGIHGFTRVIRGTVPDLGLFLTSQGFPMGWSLAWAITLTEMVGSTCLVAGRCVRLVVPPQVGILLSGIYLIHGRAGWFVVGGGRNGAEFSVLLVVALTALFIAAPGSRPSPLQG